MDELYQLSYPFEEVAGIMQMYINGRDYRIDKEDHTIRIYNYGQINFDTYYNGFSIGKWKKYTNLNSLYLKITLKGKCRITVYHKYLTAGDYLCNIVYSQEVYYKDFTEIAIDLTRNIECDGIFALEILAVEEECFFKHGAYFTKSARKKIRLGIGICTYKREKYIERFVNGFEKYNKSGNLGLFIADNGKSLPNYEKKNVFIYKNKNFGGAGGFARCMYEIKNNGTYTHIILMDDDILVDFGIFDKICAFMSLLKEEFELFFLAGSMCSMDYPFLQYEKYSSWRGDGFVQFAPNYDLRDCNTIITNEREEHLEHCLAGWWCSCFSVKMLTNNNYPFPCFFRGDDMEYTIRNGSNIITLNGINVWHEPFYKKYSIISENYYLPRNSLVINSLYLPGLSWKTSSRMLKNRFIKAILTYDYKGAEMLIRALLDYEKGIDFFEKTNPEELNSELLSENYKLLKLEDEILEYKFDDINRDLYFTGDKNPYWRKWRLITLNGYLIPRFRYKDFSFSRMGFGATTVNFYKTKKVFSLDPFTNKGYYLEISKIRALKLVIKYWRTSKRIKHRYEKIKNDYQCNFYRLQTETFWKKYLDL